MNTSLSPTFVLCAITLACAPALKETGAAAEKPFDARDVVVIDARVREPVLPPGLVLKDVRDAKKRILRDVVVQPPHVRVGELALEAEFGAGGMFADDEVVKTLRAEAGRRGANLLVLLPHGHGIAVLLAAPPPPPPETTSGELLEQKARSLGFTPVGAAAALDFSSGTPLKLLVARGRCVGLAVALEPGTKFEPGTAPLVQVTAEPALARRPDAQPVALVEQRLAEDRAFSAELGCAIVDAVALVRTSPLSPGTAAVQLLERAVTEKELLAIARAHADLEQQRAADAAERKTWCESCAGSLTGHTGKPEDSATFRACLKKFGLRAAECR